MVGKPILPLLLWLGNHPLSIFAHRPVCTLVKAYLLGAQRIMEGSDKDRERHILGGGVWYVPDTAKVLYI